MDTTDHNVVIGKSVAWKWAFTMGLVVGLLVLMTLRLEYYDAMGHEPEMHPGIAFLFFPIVFVPLCVVAFTTEVLLRRYWYRPGYWGGSALIGAGYATLYVWWAFPDHWYLIVLINPIFLRLIVGLWCKRLIRSKQVS
jgi:hypothetical protein